MARIGVRTVRRRGRELEFTVYRREHFGAGDRIEGPAIVEEHTATTIVDRGDILVVGDYGELVIEVGIGAAVDALVARPVEA